MYLLCCLGFVVGALVEFAIIILMGRASGTRNNRIGCTTMSKPKLVRIRTLNKKKNQTNRKGAFGSDTKSEKENRPVKETVENQGCASRSRDVIDFISFWLFTILFILFNLIYWYYYLVVIHGQNH